MPRPIEGGASSTHVTKQGEIEDFLGNLIDVGARVAVAMQNTGGMRTGRVMALVADADQGTGMVFIQWEHSSTGWLPDKPITGLGVPSKSQIIVLSPHKDSIQEAVENVDELRAMALSYTSGSQAMDVESSADTVKEFLRSLR